MKHIGLLLGLFFVANNLFSQGSYAPNADTQGTTAMHKDSSAFVAWASSCVVNRGLQNILDTALGYTTVGTPQSALGMAGDNDVVSLGDGGSAVLTFDYPIINGVGADFAVFENGFNNTFLELAFVEVSSNGVDFVRFPAYSETPTTTQVDGFGNLDATNIHNLAGKYKVMYGTPFDLQDIADSASIDINNITHIKIIDVVGSINPSIASYDANGNIINDPFPTPYPSSGFDLDAVGIIHSFVEVKEKTFTANISVYPNPSFGKAFVNSTVAIDKIELYDLFGKVIYTKENAGKQIMFNNLPKGIFFIHIKAEGADKILKLIVQ